MNFSQAKCIEYTLSLLDTLVQLASMDSLHSSNSSDVPTSGLSPHELQINVCELLEFEFTFELASELKCHISDLKAYRFKNEEAFNQAISHVIKEVVSPECRSHVRCRWRELRESHQRAQHATRTGAVAH